MSYYNWYQSRQFQPRPALQHQNSWGGYAHEWNTRRVFHRPRYQNHRHYAPYSHVSTNNDNLWGIHMKGYGKRKRKAMKRRSRMEQTNQLQDRTHVPDENCQSDLACEPLTSERLHEQGANVHQADLAYERLTSGVLHGQGTDDDQADSACEPLTSRVLHAQATNDDQADLACEPITSGVLHGQGDNDDQADLACEPLTSQGLLEPGADDDQADLECKSLTPRGLHVQPSVQKNFGKKSLKSYVWQHITYLEKGHYGAGHCTLCGWERPRPQNGSTCIFIGHLREQHGILPPGNYKCSYLFFKFYEIHVCIFYYFYILMGSVLGIFCY